MAQKNNDFDDTTHQFDQYITATIDATIACTQSMDVAISMGLGTCYIGGLRRFAKDVNEILNVKNTAMPVIAMTFGYASQPAVMRPKINKCYDERYDYELIKKELVSYDQLMKQYYQDVFKLDTT
jgi:FMN reductase [NAD(P)H]